ncbi:MAG: FtsQ-type POTRA domain-containing protein [Victivallales bacterium]|nr:FtsQ-type POTRA domain-containing protein [Victivallales bacterium]
MASTTSKPSSRPLPRTIGRYRGHIARNGLFLTLLVAMVVGVYYGVRSLHSYFINDNTHFSFRELDMEPTPHFSRKRVLEMLAEAGCTMPGVKPATNLLNVDMAAIRKRLLAEPTIETAELYRVMPDTIHLTIKERQPLLKLIGADNQYLGVVDENGVPVPYDASYNTITLPFVYYAFPQGAIEYGKATENRGLLAVLTLIRLHAIRPIQPHLGYNFGYILVNYKQEQLDCRLVPFADNRVVLNNAQVLFPLDTDRLLESLTRFETILKLKYEGRETITYADTSLSNNLPTRD